MRTERSAPRTTRTTKPAPSKPAAKPRASRAKTAATPLAEPAPKATVSEEMIALRAYEIFLAREGADGDPVNDWLQAEQELRGA